MQQLGLRKELGESLNFVLARQGEVLQLLLVVDNLPHSPPCVRMHTRNRAEL